MRLLWFVVDCQETDFSRLYALLFSPMSPMIPDPSNHTALGIGVSVYIPAYFQSFANELDSSQETNVVLQFTCRNWGQKTAASS